MNRDIHEYFRQFTYDPRPEDGAKPLEVVWTNAGELEIRGSTINVGDSWSILADAVPVPASPGVYELTAECFSYGTDGRVARLRGLLKGRAHDEARLEGECSVDVGSAGVVDGEALERWADDNEADAEAWMQAFMDDQVANAASICGYFPCPDANVTMFHISAGFGDGSYPVYTLLQAGEPVGFEVEFLKPGQGYFESDEDEYGEEEDV